MILHSSIARVGVLFTTLSCVHAATTPPFSSSSSSEKEPSRKSTLEYRAGKAGAHLSNAAHATKEAVRTGIALPVSGVIGAAKAPIHAIREHLKGVRGQESNVGSSLRKILTSPATGLGKGAWSAGFHSARAVRETVCAAGQACQYVRDKFTQHGINPSQRFDQKIANVVKLADFKLNSKFERKFYADYNIHSIRKLAGAKHKE